MAESKSKTEDAAPATAKSAPARKPAASRKRSVAKKTPAKAVSVKQAIEAGASSAPAAASETAAVTPATASAPEHDTAEPSITELKEKIMATSTTTTDFASNMTDTMSDAVAEMQSRMQQAYDKSAGMMAEMTDLAKGNVEAFVESGKILAGGMQDMGKTYADEAKTAYETATADIKEMAAVKSPTELFQLQGKIMRRNFDMLVATTSKNADAAMKLASESVAPISGRVNVAAEKMSKVA